MMKALAYTTRRYLPRPLREFIYRAGNFFGDEFVTSAAHFDGTASSPMALLLTRLRQLQFEPQTVVDCGAYRGDWTRLAKRVFPAARVLMIEPQRTLSPVLRTVCSYYEDVTYVSALLASCDGSTVDFFQMGTGSSVLEEASSVPRTTIGLQTRTLDAVTDDCGFDAIDLLKLDVQGYEVEVLKGASRRLASCEFVLLEASLIPVNRACPLVADVVAFMAGNGFRLFDLGDVVRRRDGTLWQMDLLFVNDRSRFVPLAALTAENW